MNSTCKLLKNNINYINRFKLKRIVIFFTMNDYTEDDYGPSFLQMGNSLIEAELSQTISSETVTLETFQTVLSDKTKINKILELAEKSIEYFVAKDSELINYIWGINHSQFILIERRLKEVFKRSYSEYVSVFSFMSMSAATRAEITRLIAEEMALKNGIFKKKYIKISQLIKHQSNHLERLSLVLRGLYLNHAKLKQEDWIKVEDDLKYIRSADEYIRRNRPEFIETKSKNINVDGLLWLNRQLKQKYQRQYHHFNDDFPLIAEAWTMGVVSVKQSEFMPEITKLPKNVQKKIQYYAQLANTLMGLHKIELEIRLKNSI